MRKDNVMEKDEETLVNDLINLAAKLVIDPNNETVRQDPLFIEKKEAVLQFLTALSIPKVREEGNHRYAFPLNRDQKEVQDYIKRINEGNWV